MTPDNIDAVAEVYRSGGWDRRRLFLQTMVAAPTSHALVGVGGGAVVAAGLATVNGQVGRVGSISVDPSGRRPRIGRTIAEAVCTRLDAAG
jgi:ribosomal protein S18 acetylase RimI-like enzyme